MSETNRTVLAPHASKPALLPDRQQKKRAGSRLPGAVEAFGATEFSVAVASTFTLHHLLYSNWRRTSYSGYKIIA
jgi:hypothetical protein